MTLVYEHLGYNRQGLRYITAKELREKRKQILTHNFFSKVGDSQCGDVMLWFLKLLGSTIAHQEEKQANLITKKRISIISKNSARVR